MHQVTTMLATSKMWYFQANQAKKSASKGDD